MGNFRSNQPLGTTDVKVLLGNASNFDEAMHEKILRYWLDRFGRQRLTWHGIEELFQEFLVNSGYQDMGDYVVGLGLTARNQMFHKDGELYRASAALALPYMLTGDWAQEKDLFVVMGDQALRQQLSDTGSDSLAAGMVGFGFDASYSENSVGGAITRRVHSIEELRALPGRFPGDTITLTGYHKGKSAGAGDFIWLEDSSEADDGGFYIQATGSIWERASVSIRPEDFGSKGDGADDTVAIESSLRRAIKSGIQLIATKSYSINAIDLSDETGSLDLKLTGKITRLPSSSKDELIKFGDKDGVRIYGGGTIDFNFQNQEEWVEGLTFDKIGDLAVAYMKFRNAKKSDIYMRSHYVSGFIRNCKFIDGALHSGKVEEACIFLKTRGGIDVRVTGNRFIQTTDPLPGQCRNPGGFMNIDTGAPQARAEASLFIVEGNYFENLGHHCAGNLVAPLEFDSYVGTIHINDNVLRKSRITPIRTSAGHLTTITGNNIVQHDEQFIDGGALYGDAALIALSLVDRDYPSDDNDISNAVVRDNRLRINGPKNCSGVIATSGSPDFLYRKISVSDNHIRAFPESNKQAVFVSKVRTINVSENDLEGFAQLVRVEGTNVAPLVSGGPALCTVEKNRFSGGDIYVWARTSVDNLHIALRDNVGASSRIGPFTLRGLKSAVVDGNLFDGVGPGDVQTIGSFWMRDNDTNSTVPPTGYLSLPFYRITDNKGIPNATSA